MTKDDEPLTIMDMTAAVGGHRLGSMLMALDTDEFEFEVKRKDPNPKVTFSADAMEGLFEAVQTFVSARVLRKFNETGVGPHNLRVKVSVEFQ